MLQVEDQIETIHLYVVREKEKRPFTFLPLCFAFLCLACLAGVTLYSAEYPTYEHKRLTIPAQFLPLQTFAAVSLIVPTGIKTYPATAAHGILTITNGSIIAQIIPQGFIVDGVATDAAVFVPAGSASGYGYVTVTAHALQVGKKGNILPGTINVVEGSSTYIRNLTSFIGGADAYSVKVITNEDRQTAIAYARTSLQQASDIKAILVSPCREIMSSGHVNSSAFRTSTFLLLELLELRFKERIFW